MKNEKEESIKMANCSILSGELKKRKNPNLYWKPLVSTSIWFIIIMIPIIQKTIFYAFSSLYGIYFIIYIKTRYFFSAFIITIGSIITINLLVLFMINYALGKSNYGNSKKSE